MDLSSKFWDDKYKNDATGWDLGSISTPLKNYIDQLENKDLKILTPGGGNSYEAEYLHQKGFTNVYVIDLSKIALDNVKKRVPTFPIKHLININFFDIQDTFDIILEQTFFCSLNPSLRKLYAKKTYDSLNKKGKLVGLLFCIPLYSEHPPFGGNKEEYLGYFDSFFTIKIMNSCYNSVDSRKESELFIKLVKK